MNQVNKTKNKQKGLHQTKNLLLQCKRNGDQKKNKETTYSKKIFSQCLSDKNLTFNIYNTKNIYKKKMRKNKRKIPQRIDKGMVK